MDHLPDEREQNLSERFDRGDHASRNDPDEAVLQDYEQIGQLLRAYPVRKLDRAALSQRIARTCGTRSWRGLRGFRVLGPALQPGLVTACVVLCAVLYSLSLLLLPGRACVVGVEFVGDSTGVQHPVSYWLEKRLQHGRLIAIPSGTTADFALADGSIVSCSSETRIALDFRDRRHIQLDAGSIIVRAASIPGSTMVVETPLADVNVVGTTFWVEVVRQDE